jgi:hypothetical protein
MIHPDSIAQRLLPRHTREVAPFQWTVLDIAQPDVAILDDTVMIDQGFGYPAIQ